MNTADIRFTVHDNLGGTFHVFDKWSGLAYTPVEFSDGYLVAESGGLKQRYPFSAEQIETFIEDQLIAELDVAYLGFWYDQETSMWYLDSTHYVEQLGVALRTGAEWGQLAIWDNLNQTSINVLDSQPRNIAEAIPFWDDWIIPLPKSKNS